MTHSVAVNVYPATARMPQLTIVVVDTIPIEPKRLVYGLELVYLCAGRQSVAGHSAVMGGRVGGACGRLNRWRVKSVSLRNIIVRC